ncbi:MAG: hypothetical protein Q8P93_00245 [bacterium]|nr:hypothetical protein [bacterium]
MKKIVATLSVYALPVLAFGETVTSTNIPSVLVTFTVLLSLIPTILLALAIIYFMYGLAIYILGASKSENRSQAIEIMIWGGIAIFVMVTITSIIRVVQNTFGIYGDDAINAPRVTPTRAPR